MIRRLLSEPLVHFFALGALLFVAYAQLGEPQSGDGEIVVSSARQSNLFFVFERSWQRAPNADEKQRLVQDFINEEVAYREAQRMKLDLDDVIIRRRMQQKLELLAEDLMIDNTPTDAQLAQWLDQHRDRYRQPATVTVDHLYLDDPLNDSQIQALIQQLNLQPHQIPTGLGPPLGIVSPLRGVDEQQLDRLFGRGVGKQLVDLKRDVWVGPIASGLGLHLVRVVDHAAAIDPPLEQVRAQVERDWIGDHRDRAIDAMYKQLREQYQIVIEPQS